MSKDADGTPAHSVTHTDTATGKGGGKLTEKRDPERKGAAHPDETPDPSNHDTSGRGG